MAKNTVGYSLRTFAKTIQPEIKEHVINAVATDKDARAEISRVFQQANRRIQNIESKGLLSPAVTALGKQGIKGYTKFSMRGDWDTLKAEYAKAVGFLQQPTSTATGTREYNRHIQQAYNLSEQEFQYMADRLNEKLQSVSASDFVDKYLMRYKDFTGELEQAARDVAEQIESDAMAVQNAIDREISDTADNAANQIGSAIQEILNALDDFGL